MEQIVFRISYGHLGHIKFQLIFKAILENKVEGEDFLAIADTLQPMSPDNHVGFLSI